LILLHRKKQWKTIMLTQLNPQLQQRIRLSMPEIATFFQRWHITELSLFGSVLGDRFHTDRDIDILICLAPNTRQGLLTLAKIKHDLEASTGRVVDLAMKNAIENSENWMHHLTYPSPIFGRSPPTTPLRLSFK
jgi:uncharacterized protein